mgnify:CR=1 FL=1
MTPSESHRVFVSRLGSVVEIRCCQISSSGERNEANTTHTGTSTTPATRNGKTRQARRIPYPASQLECCWMSDIAAGLTEEKSFFK